MTHKMNPVAERVVVIVLSMWATIGAVYAAPTVSQNSMRGYYEWHNGNMLPQPGIAAESYQRFAWKQLEPMQDRYDFSVIDKAMGRARTRGQRIAFRVMPASSGHGALVPAYLVDALKGGVWFTDPRSAGSPNTYFPDWNDPLFLDRTRRLIEALGARYDGNPYIAWIEIGSYGNWGEWHTSPYKYPSAQGSITGTDETKRAIVDMYLHAFKRTRLIMMTDDSVGLMYALGQSPTVGIRRDSLGVPWFDNGLKQDPKRASAVLERWKTAPFITEYYGFSKTAPNLAGAFRLAAQQVKEWHVCMVGNGNIPHAAQMSPEAVAMGDAVGDAAGYDYHAVVSGAIAGDAGHRYVDISATWTNSGNSPTYDRWTVRYQLVSADATKPTISLGDSKLDLRTLLPGTTETNERFLLPTGITDGTYGLSVSVLDPGGVRPAMRFDEPPMSARLIGIGT